MWIGFAIGLEQTLIWGPFDLSLSGLVSFGLAQLVLLAGPLLFVISTVRAWAARGALARALGDSTLQVAFQQPDGAGGRRRRAAPAGARPA